MPRNRGTLRTPWNQRGKAHGRIREVSTGQRDQGEPVRLDLDGGGAEQPETGRQRGSGEGKADEQGTAGDPQQADAQRARKRKVMEAPPLWLKQKHE